MSNELDPVVDQWYQRRDKGGMLRVVAVDSAAGLVEIQDFNGDIEELDIDAWRDMDIDLAAEPEDWTGPYDDVEADDLGYTETEMRPQDWRTPLDSPGAEDERDTESDEPDEEE